MAKKIQNKEFNSSKLVGFIVIVCFSMFFINFIYKVITTESVDSTKRWCPTHNTYHDINEEIVDEVWCNNCKTWHTPNQESRTPTIR